MTRRTVISVGLGAISVASIGLKNAGQPKLWLAWAMTENGKASCFRAYSATPPSTWIGPIYVHHDETALRVSRIISETELPLSMAEAFEKEDA